MWAERGGASINQSGCRDVVHSRGIVLASTHPWCQRPSRVCPWWLQLGVELTPPPPNSIVVELVRVEYLSSLEHEVHRAGELGGQHRERLALAVFSLKLLV